MQDFIVTTEIKKTYTLAQVIRGTKHPDRAKSFLIKKDRNYNTYMKLLSSVIKTNRWELLKSYGPYTVILNGYGEFKCIRMSDGTKYDYNYIFNALLSL